MEKLTLNDGTELLDSYAVETLDNLFLYIRSGLNMMQVFMLVYDPNKISMIKYTAGDTVTEYGGYTMVQGITQEHGGMISVVLRRA